MKPALSFGLSSNPASPKFDAPGRGTHEGDVDALVGLAKEALAAASRSSRRR
jgi:hypothetical protein